LAAPGAPIRRKVRQGLGLARARGRGDP